ncbi:MAG: hypothetical protein ACOCRX_00605 [Candidatus Woesearchaeota archaeon]
MNLWTEPDLMRLRVYTERGLTDKQIGKLIKRSRSAVETKRLELGIIKRGKTQPPWEKKYILALNLFVMQGLHDIRIAELMNKSPDEVYAKKRELGLSIQSQQIAQ